MCLLQNIFYCFSVKYIEIIECTLSKTSFDLCSSPHRKLTKEEFERRNNEDRLTEVDGKALEAEEEVKVCRQRIKEIQDELKQTEKSYKAQIIEQEQKSHENWVCTTYLLQR